MGSSKKYGPGSCSAKLRIIRSSTCSSCSAAGRKTTPDTLLSALLDQFGYQTAPAGLVARAETGAVIPVKIFVEEEQVFPVRIALKDFGAARDGTPAVLAANKNMNEAAGDFGCHFPEI